jgi:hypothetical protein
MLLCTWSLPVRPEKLGPIADDLQGGAAVEEARGKRLKAKSTPQGEHDATVTGWGW